MVDSRGLRIKQRNQNLKEELCLLNQEQRLSVFSVLAQMV